MNFNDLKKRFTLSKLFGFFLVSAFPFHLWKIIMLMRDYSWITERADLSSFLGVAALSMLYALAESLLYFVLLLILGLLIPWKWHSDRVFSILGFTAIWLPIWDMLAQVYRAVDFQNPDFLILWLFSTGHPIRYGYSLLIAFAAMVIILTVGGIWLTSFNQKFQRGVQNFLERIGILSALYLLLDIAAVIILLVRLI